MFLGNFKSKRPISLGGSSSNVKKETLLQQAHHERKEREQQRWVQIKAKVIQVSCNALIQGFLEKLCDKTEIKGEITPRISKRRRLDSQESIFDLFLFSVCGFTGLLVSLSRWINMVTLGMGKIGKRVYKSALRTFENISWTFDGSRVIFTRFTI